MLMFEILALINTIFIIKWKLAEFCRIGSTNSFIFARNQHTVFHIYTELSFVDIYGLL